MPLNQQSTELLDTVSKILLRCFLLGLLLLVIWSACMVLAPGLIHRVHGNLFDLSPHELNVVLYGALAFTKIIVLLFFGFPYLAIRLVLRKN